MQAVAVLGMGKVGMLACELLHQAGFEVRGYDLRDGPGHLPFPIQRLDVTQDAEVATAFAQVDAVLSCLPYHLNLSLARAACAADIHYFDLTEDVPTTQAILDMSKSGNRLLAPQCGLAPGFVGIVGAHLIASLDTCRACRMRVGALPQNPSGLMGYSFNWSPEGVVNEYLNDCEVLEGGEIKQVSPMEWIEKLYIDGVELEAFTTSGGLGTMCQTYHGQVPDMDYKTMRYPGHAKIMNFFFHELLMRDRRKEAGEILVNAKPPVSDDVVYVHVAAEGTRNGTLLREEFVRAYKPMKLAGKRRTAISWTTASSVVAIMEMVRGGALQASGFLKQEDVPLDGFLATSTGSNYAAD